MIPMILMGAGGYGYICIGAAYDEGFSLGWFVMGFVTLVIALLVSAYLFRGRGPTTQQVQAHLRAQQSDTRSQSHGGGWRAWAWNTLTNEGRAQSAHERGDMEYEARLQVDNGSHLRKVREIEAQGWRRVHQVIHPQEKKTDVTAHADGTHTLVRSSTQYATYYFVRDHD